MVLRSMLAGLAVIGLGLAQQAQRIPKLEGVVYWPAAKIEEYDKILKAREHPVRNGRRTNSVYEQLGGRGRYSLLEGLRDGDTAPEAHEGIDDLFIIQQGEATLLYGGKVEGVPQVKTGAMHGGRLVGAQSLKLSEGDVVVVPGDIPHQMSIAKGKSLTFLCIKVDNR